MSPFCSSLDLSAAAYTKWGIRKSRDMREMYESARPIQPTSYGYFWDAEELRHQEHLHRVSHAQYLYQHRHDSKEAARIYKSLVGEQSRWMDQQEWIKEMGSSLSARAYQQRASRFEEEWKRLEGRADEGISKAKSGLQRGPNGISFEGDDEHDLSDLIMTLQTISSLHLPDPLLSIPGPSKFVFCESNLQQFDGAQLSKSHDHAQARRGTRVLKLDTQANCGQSDGRYSVPYVSRIQPAEIIQPHPSSSLHETSRLSRSSKNFHNQRIRPTPNERLVKGNIRTGVSKAESSLSSDCSTYSSSPTTNSHPRDQQEQCRGPPLSAGEVLRVINYKPWGNNNYLYYILWKPHNLGVPAELWVRALDFAKSGKKVILEDYHLHHSLGPVCWPRDPRRQWRPSTSLEVQEIKSTLDERKQVLLDRGANEFGASREMNEEQWIMRDKWQRAGRGWGSALMIVEERKEVWGMAESDIGEARSTLAASAEDALRPQKSSERDFPGNLAMLQAAGIMDLDVDQGALKQDSSDSNLANVSSPSPSINPANQSPSSLDCGIQTGELEHLEKVDEQLRSEFAVTSEDEREWREHFMLEPIESRLSKIKAHSGRLSRVKSTLHDLPRGANLELVRAVTLPELHERITILQPLLKKGVRGIAKPPEPKSPKPISSTLSEVQSHLKTQRKNLLSRMLSHGSSKRRPRRNPKLMHQSNSLNDSDAPFVEGGQPILLIETATEPFGGSENQQPEGQLGQHTATPRSPSYISLDNASASFKTPVKESRAKKVWERFSHLLVSRRVSRGVPSKDRKKRRTKVQTPIQTSHLPMRGKQVPFALAIDPTRTDGNPAKTAVVDAEMADSGNILGKSQHNRTQLVEFRRVQWQRYPMYAAGPSALKSTMVETSASRTALWTASLSPMLRKSKSEEPRRVKWASRSTSGEDLVAEMIFTPSRTGTETILETTDLNQISFGIPSGASTPSNQTHLMERSRRPDKGKYRAKLEPHSLVSEQTRTNSQQQYLANREAEREARRDRNILKTKEKGRKMKEKADQRAEQFKRLNRLYSKKACPLGKWSNRDQVELELLRMKLRLRGAKNSWKRNDLRKLGMAELQALRESLLPTARVASRKPKGRSPAW